MENKNKKKTVKTFTSGRHYKVKLRGKMKANGYWSLYLEYYMGKKKSTDGTSIAQRKFEFLDIHLKDRPSNPDERKEKEEMLQLAMEIRENRQKEIQYNQEGIINPKRRDINFIDYFQNFHDYYPNKDIRIVRYCLKYFKEFVDDTYIAPHEITEDFLIRFKAYLEEHLKGETPHNYFTKMKKVVKKAFNDRIISSNTGENIKNKRKEGLKKDILSLDEIQSIASTKCGNPEIKKAFLFSLNTGLRYCDIKALKWQHVQSDRLMVFQSKTSEYVYVDLNDNAKRLIDIKNGIYDELVFNLPSLTSCLKTLKTWTKEAGIQKNITWHSARHSIAVNLLSNGSDIKTVSGILGHTSIKHTEKYTRVIDSLKKKAINSLPNIELS
jgi:integrase/recombinase XerD